MLKRSLLSVAAVATALALAACGGSDEDAAEDPGAAPSSETPGASSSAPAGASGSGRACTYSPDGSSPDPQVPPATSAFSADVPATINLATGPLAVTLHGTTAPCTVNSFAFLATQGYFDGTTCHRLTTRGIFVLQCGDPTGTGRGTPGYSFDDELSGSETYPAGTLAMANAGPNTNGSQFFIVYAPTELPPSYTVFGTVDPAGIKAVEAIAAKGTAEGTPDGTPKEPVQISGVTVG